MTRVRTVKAYVKLLRDEVEQYHRYGALTQDKRREILQQLSVVEELFAKLEQPESPDCPG